MTQTLDARRAPATADATRAALRDVYDLAFRMRNVLESLAHDDANRTWHLGRAETLLDEWDRYDVEHEAELAKARGME